MFLARADASVAAFPSHFGGLRRIRGDGRVDDWLVRFCFRLLRAVPADPARSVATREFRKRHR
jgi:hypothetical protein